MNFKNSKISFCLLLPNSIVSFLCDETLFNNSQELLLLNHTIFIGIQFLEQIINFILREFWRNVQNHLFKFFIIQSIIFIRIKTCEQISKVYILILGYSHQFINLTRKYWIQLEIITAKHLFKLSSINHTIFIFITRFENLCNFIRCYRRIYFFQ